jgi:hypothetical protein
VSSSWLHPRRLWYPISRPGDLFHGIFAASGVFGVVFLMRCALAGCLLSATAILRVRFSRLLEHIESSGTSSSRCARLSLPLVTLSVLICVSSTKAYPACVPMTAHVFSLSYLSIHASLTSSVALSFSSCELLAPFPSAWTVSMLLNSLIRSSLPSYLTSLPGD